MIREARRDDVSAILEIYNHAIVNTTAVYRYKPLTMEDRLAWFDGKVADGLPLLVYEVDGAVIGFATYGPFRPWPAYKYTVEHSVYVHPAHQGKRVGTELLAALIEVADEKGYATMVAGIDAGNEASRVLHERLGFKECGRIERAGYKFGRWLDLAFYQLQLRGPESPVEG